MNTIEKTENMYTRSLKIFVLCIFFAKTLGYSVVFPDVYWRHYTGVVPEDAVPGGYDPNNQTTYIGQGYIKDRGIIPGVIYSGENQITVPIRGTKVINTYIKILCSSQPHSFKWLPATSELLHLSSINKYLVPGGVEDNHLVYIGRLAFQGQLITGKVITHGQQGKAPMYFNYRDAEKSVNSYEVLTVDPDVHIILPRTRVEPARR